MPLRQPGVSSQNTVTGVVHLTQTFSFLADPKSVPHTHTSNPTSPSSNPPTCVRNGWRGEPCEPCVCYVCVFGFCSAMGDSRMTSPTAIHCCSLPLNRSLTLSFSLPLLSLFLSLTPSQRGSLQAGGEGWERRGGMGKRGEIEKGGGGVGMEDGVPFRA